MQVVHRLTLYKPVAPWVLACSTQAKPVANATPGFQKRPIDNSYFTFKTNKDKLKTYS